MPEEPLKSLPKDAQVLGTEIPKPLKSLPSDIEVLGVDKSFVPHIDDFNPSVSQEPDVEATLNDIVKTSYTNISDGEKDMLRDMLKNPNLTPEQAKESIQTIQGYHPKQEYNTMITPNYYVKKDANGVIRPIPLGKGELPPKGHNVANVWGQTKKQAQDDSWYTDLSKSLFNALPELAKTAAEIGNFSSLAITGEESDFFNRAANTSESLKLNKDDNGGKTLYNPSEANKFAELFSADRFELSKESLWNTVNWAVETLPQFIIGAAEVGYGIKGSKLAYNTLRGIQGTTELGKAGIAASIFGSSFAMNLGENMEAAKEAGLTGRDIAKVVGPTTVAMASIDAFTGLDIGAKLFSSGFKIAEKQLLKKFVSEIEKDPLTGLITDAGMKKLGKEFSVQYYALAKSFAKEAVKDTGGEMTQEALQTFTQRAGEQIWDNMSGEDKAKFGTDAFDAKSFGQYLSSGINSLGVAPVSLLTASANKEKYDEQSIDAAKIVEGGKDRMDEFKANLYAAHRSGDLTEQERDQAVFKIDSYDKYNRQLKTFPEMSKEDKKEVFEKSFNIEALKSETNIPKEDLDKLSPVELGIIDNKKIIINDLQKELNHILLKQDIKTETKVPQKTVDKVAKEEGLEFKDKDGDKREATLPDLIKKFGALKGKKTDSVNFEEPPKRRKIEEVSTDEWNQLAYSDPLKIKTIVQEHLKAVPKNEIDVIIRGAQNERITADVGDNKQVWFSQSVKSTDPDKKNYFRYENLPATKVEVENKGGNTNINNIGKPKYYYKEPAVMKRVEFPSKNKDGKKIIKAVLPVYNKETGKFIGFSKEHVVGKSKYSPADEVHLNKIMEANWLTDDLKEYEHKVKEQKTEAIPAKKEPKPTKQVKLNPIDEQLEQIDYEQTRPLEQTEVQQEFGKREAQEQFEASGISQYQKQSIDRTKDSFKITDRLKKVAPKVKWVYDNKLKAAGQVKGNTITINPFYAGHDTPIHEIGHILIDTIGYNNKVIQAAIKQLQGTKLWEQTKERYHELSEEQLGKEVLAEAIGREGAEIFDEAAQRSKFKAFLDYIFDKLKQLLGMDKNIVRSLAKQIIGGVKTEGLEGKNEVVQEQKPKGNYSDYERRVQKLYEDIKNEPDLSKFPYEDLIEVYNVIQNTEGLPKGKLLKNIMVRIAMNIFDRKVEQIKSDPKFSIDRAVREDITVKDIKFKVLSHFTDSFPDLQVLSNLWDSAYFNKVKEAKEGKKVNEKLAIDVIKDRNKRIGIIQRGKEALIGLFSNINHKYFDYLDNGKGQIITLAEAKNKGLSKPQIDYLNYVRELISSRQQLMENEDIYNMDMEVLRLDKGFTEAFGTDGLTQAFSGWLGSNHNLRSVRVKFFNPNTNKDEFSDFGTIESELVKYGNKGVIEKSKSLALLLRYNYKARRQLKKGVNEDQSGENNILNIAKGGEYTLDENGELRSKFDRKIDKTRSYSKNFYKAVQQYIDDNAHVKNISPLIPIINSIEYLNANGAYQNKTLVHSEKPKVVKWMKEWTNLHVLQKADEGIPELDASLRFLRFMTSATTMMFNVSAGIMNVAIGNYNIWRSENLKTWFKGQQRLFLQGKRKLGKDYAFGGVNPYAVDIARKYGAVSTDVDSNPLRTIGGTLTDLGFIMTKYGEFQIQASGLLGLMNDVDYNSFEYKENSKGIEELVIKDGVDEKALEARILAHINSVSDVQGKYSDKDKRNIMNNELGKALLQFKIYLPDWYRIRYGENGSWTTMFRGGLKELKDEIKEKGFIEGFLNSDSKAAKNTWTNLKGAMTVAFFMSLSYRDDDDEKKRSAATKIDKALGNLLVIFDPDQLKFTLTRPIAAMSVIEKFINAADHLAAFEEDDFYRSNGKYGDKGDSKIGGDIVKLLPGQKVIDAAEMLNDEE